MRTNSSPSSASTIAPPTVSGGAIDNHDIAGEEGPRLPKITGIMVTLYLTTKHNSLCQRSVRAALLGAIAHVHLDDLRR
jgi:hypothetical protein